MTGTDHPDVLIVGSGIMGAIVARLLREHDAGARIVMVDGGRPIGETAGLHLHDVPDPELWDRYNERVSSGIQGMYTGAEVVREVAPDAADLTPGMFHALALGEDADSMPASALAWNAGGMGIHWTAATPWPSGSETFAGGADEAWAADLATAREALGVTPVAFPPTAPGAIVLDVLRNLFAGVGSDDRRPQPMPMAVRRTAEGSLARTGPATIFPPIGGADDAGFTLMTGSLATRILHDDDSSRARGVRVRDVATGVESDLHAHAVIVCADVVRTPQLLFASGIRPDALGRHLNEHAFVTGRVLMDLDRFGLRLADLPALQKGEFCTDSLWLPHNGDDQPLHGQIMNTTYADAAGEPLAYSVGISLYTPVESRPDNRLRFSDTEVDVFGMPRVTYDFAYSERDLAHIDGARAQLQRIAESFGPFDPATESALLEPGSSLHLTGTVRTGEVDDGTSVCDPDGRVWGWQNLFVAGNGVIPTPVVANATLTGAITAVRAARALSRLTAPAAL